MAGEAKAVVEEDGTPAMAPCPAAGWSVPRLLAFRPLFRQTAGDNLEERIHAMDVPVPRASPGRLGESISIDIEELIQIDEDAGEFFERMGVQESDGTLALLRLRQPLQGEAKSSLDPGGRVIG